MWGTGRPSIANPDYDTAIVLVEQSAPMVFAMAQYCISYVHCGQ